MNKYEQLIEFIINEQEDKARDLFHQLVVEKSRDIYENLIDENDFDEDVGGNQVQGLMNDVTADETSGMHEDDEEIDADSDADLGGDEMDGEMDGEMGDDMGGEEGTPEEKIENTIMDLESALDELKAEFDQLMGKGGDDMGGMDDMGGDDMGGMDDMGGDDAGGEFGAPGAEDDSIMREYVEDHGQIYKQAPATGEGKTVGKGGDAPAVNKQSIVAKPNRMGGSAGNIVKGGTEQSADGKPVPTPSNQYTKGRGELKGAGSFENTPNAHTKGYTNRATSYEKAKGKEGETTDGKLPVTSKSVVGGKIR